jgi:hypothetical protein
VQGRICHDPLQTPLDYGEMRGYIKPRGSANEYVNTKQAVQEPYTYALRDFLLIQDYSIGHNPSRKRHGESWGDSEAFFDTCFDPRQILFDFRLSVRSTI